MKPYEERYSKSGRVIEITYICQKCNQKTEKLYGIINCEVYCRDFPKNLSVSILCIHHECINKNCDHKIPELTGKYLSYHAEKDKIEDCDSIKFLSENEILEVLLIYPISDKIKNMINFSLPI